MSCQNVNCQGCKLRQMSFVMAEDLIREGYEDINALRMHANHSMNALIDKEVEDDLKHYINITCGALLEAFFKYFPDIPAMIQYVNEAEVDYIPSLLIDSNGFSDNNQENRHVS